MISIYATIRQFAQLYPPLRQFTLLYATLRLFTPLYATLLYLGTPLPVKTKLGRNSQNCEI